MATEIVERKLDDVFRQSGIRKEADTTTYFSYKGRDFKIDLTKENDKDFDDAIEPFLEAATEVTGRRKGGSAKKSTPPATAIAPKKKAAAKSNGASTEADAIREWARSQGLQVSDRGRIADSVKAAYYAGHPKPSEAMPTRALPVPAEPEVEESELDTEDSPYDYDEDPYGQL